MIAIDESHFSFNCLMLALSRPFFKLVKMGSFFSARLEMVPVLHQANAHQRVALQVEIVLLGNLWPL